MRFLLIALMMVLTPVRGLMSDAMAIGMFSTQQMAQTAQAAGATTGQASAVASLDASKQPAHHHDPSGTLEDCADAAAPALITGNCSADGSGCATQVAQGCESCSACQSCHGVELVTNLSGNGDLLRSRRATTAALTDFVSAEREPALKTPIS